MKLEIENILHLAASLDSSESIMLTKGGRLKREIKDDSNNGTWELTALKEKINAADKLIISFEAKDLSRTSWISKEAENCRNYYDKDATPTL